MSDIICKHCGLMNDYKTVRYAPDYKHWGAAVCNGCGIHIQWLPNPDRSAVAFKDTTPMPFGKYKGQYIGNVPADYLLWMKDNIPKLHPGIKEYINDNLDVLRAQIQQAR